MFGQHDDQQNTGADENTADHETPSEDGTLSQEAVVQTVAPTTDTAADHASAPFLADGEKTAGATPSPALDMPSPVTPAAASSSNDDLLSIKQEALKQLSPLVNHLNQTPEEKFRTTMMMIQAADDEKLVKTAYEAAQAISDEKTRAQALLDIINEINYFTQQHDA